MAMANITVQAGWSDQEIANLLIAHRRRYNEDLKLRDSYYCTTIATARAAFSEEVLDLEIQQLATPAPKPVRDDDGEQKQEPPVKEDPAQKKSKLCDVISEKFKLSGDHWIVRFAEYQSEPREYGLEIANGQRIRVGSIQNLLDPHALRMKIAELAHCLIPPFKKNDFWECIQKDILSALVEVQVGDEGTDAGLVNSWLAAYLATKAVLDTYDASDETRSPFMRNGRIHIHLGDLRKWVHLNHGDRIPPKEMGLKMRLAGGVPEKVAHGKSSRQVWMLAEAFVSPAKSVDAPAWVTEEQPPEGRVN